MIDCEFCAILNGDFESEELYTDDKVTAVLHLKPASPGHILLFTKEHYPIIEQVPDFVVGHAFKVANKLSTAIFESLSVQGTNIVVENGTAAGQSIAHFSVHVIPRNENDGLKLEWQPTKPGKEEVEIAHYQIKQQAESIHPSAFEKEKEVVVEEKKEEKPVKDDFRWKQVRRIP